MKPKLPNCPICKQRKKLTVHHILPQSKFPLSPEFNLCRKCHDGLEHLVDYWRSKKQRELFPSEYFFCWLLFTYGGEWNDQEIETLKRLKGGEKGGV